MSAPPAEPAGGRPGPDWERLPDAVRHRLAEVAAIAVGEMPAVDVPAPLRRVARFAPAKRARLGAKALLAELGSSSAFRTAVVAWWEEHRPRELSTAEDAVAADPVTAAAAALLTGDGTAGEIVEVVARRDEAGEVRAERDTAVARVDKLTVELERLRGALAEAGAPPAALAEVGSHAARFRV